MNCACDSPPGWLKACLCV